MASVSSEMSPVGFRAGVAIDRATRYGYTTEGGAGEFEWIDKTLLRLPVYQRPAGRSKKAVASMRKAWSWIKCGALSVTRRGGEYWVLDGGNRLAGAMQTSLVKKLPCLVFEFASDAESGEADVFLDINMDRSPVNVHDRHRAAKLGVRDRKAHEAVDALLAKHGYEIRENPSAPEHTRSVTVFLRLNRHPDALDAVLELCRKSRRKEPLQSLIVLGLFLLETRLEGGLRTGVLAKRTKEKGLDYLLASTRGYCAAQPGERRHTAINAANGILAALGLAGEPAYSLQKTANVRSE